MATTHPCGALNGIDSDGDGLTGILQEDGYYRLAIEQAGSGVYDDTGAIRVTDATSETDPVGVYAADGSWNVTFVDGTELVGFYADNGSINFIDNTPEE